jgi:5-keto 4-deoxyuronate isomerase
MYQAVIDARTLLFDSHSSKREVHFFVVCIYAHLTVTIDSHSSKREVHFFVVCISAHLTVTTIKKKKS